MLFRSDSFLEALYATGGKMPAKQVDWKAVKPGERLVGIDTRGRQVGTIEGPPPRELRATGLQAKFDAYDALAAEGEISADEASKLKKQAAARAATGLKQGGGTGGGAGGGTGAPTGLSDEDAAFMAQQYLRGDQSVFTNLGRGAQEIGRAHV